MNTFQLRVDSQSADWGLISIYHDISLVRMIQHYKLWKSVDNRLGQAMSKAWGIGQLNEKFVKIAADIHLNSKILAPPTESTWYLSDYNPSSSFKCSLHGCWSHTQPISKHIKLVELDSEQTDFARKWGLNLPDQGRTLFF
jgi:hypothetical protein